MERTESVVIQVAPSYENQKIEEMQIFGWNLQGRQEIHEEGDAYGRPSYLSDSTYIVKTTVHHYVKLHFVRSLRLPNLKRFREIENEYANLPFLSPPSLKGPGCLIAFFAIGIFPALAVMSEGKIAEGFGMLVVYGLFVGLGVVWLRKRQAKRQEANAISQRSLDRAKELLAAARKLSSKA
jgi:hypothetical protein